MMSVLHRKVNAVLLSAFVLHHQHLHSRGVHLQGHLSAVCCLLKLEATGKFASERLAPDPRASL